MRGGGGGVQRKCERSEAVQQRNIFAESEKERALGKNAISKER
jgi:hypothetical protein